MMKSINCPVRPTAGATVNFCPQKKQREGGKHCGTGEASHYTNITTPGINYPSYNIDVTVIIDLILISYIYL